MSLPCGCCTGIARLTPAIIANRPGLSAISYRVGTHASFMASMEASLSGIEPLQALRTRLADDPAIALLDAWATVADVLSFYQERIGNEGYLETATERQSIIELARLVGYRLRPGVASSVYLAFALEPDYVVPVPAGTRAQSLPGPGELPQSFETSEAIAARTAWNVLRPRLLRPQRITAQTIGGLGTIYFKGTSTGLGPNDPILVIFLPPTAIGMGQTPPAVRWVETVKPEPSAARTVVTLQSVPGVPAPPDSTQIVAGVNQVLAKFQDLAAYGIAAAKTAQDILSQLRDFAGGINASMSGNDIADQAQGLLKEIGAALDRATQLGYSKLEPWLTDLQAALQAALNPQPPVPTLGDKQGAAPAPETLSFDDTVSALAAPPSIPPPTSTALARSIGTIFAPGSDASLQLLSSLNPAVGGTLYDALSSSAFTTPPVIQEIDALPLKAAVFGHNAPLKPVLNSQGVVVGSEEWPLDGVSSADVSLELTKTGTIVHISMGQGGVTQTTQLPIPANPTTVSLFNQTLNVSPTNISSELLVGCQVVFPQTTISVDPTGHVTVDTSFDQQLNVGDAVVAATPSGRIHAEYTSSTIHVHKENAQPLAPQAQKMLTLDAVYDKILPHSWVVIKRPRKTPPVSIHQVNQAETVSVAEFGMTGRVTQLTLADAWLDNTDLMLSDIRDTSVFGASHPLDLADAQIDSIEEPINGDRIELDRLYDGLKSGRWLVVTGERLDIPGATGVKGTELSMLADVELALDANLPGDVLHTRLVLAAPLAYVYKRDTVIIYGNVAHATQGETRTQVLGSGDGRVPGQRFTLNQSPLTYVSASNPSGVDSTLHVRVNEVLWRETDSLAGLGPADREYTTTTNDKDKTTVIFGNGERGARLPSGVENVRAAYRTGIGKPGNLGAGRISLLATKPLGVKSVVNPIPATGGADREGRDSGRRNAPLAVMALDRLVSVEDYADFARTFAGIGKASARRLSDGRQQVVHVTIAGDGDIPIATTSDLFRNLSRALRQFGDPMEAVRLAVRELVELLISLRVRVLPDYAWEFVGPNVRSALLDAFGFDRREIGQAVEQSEVLSVVQRVPGVAYVDLDVLAGVPQTITTTGLQQLAQGLVVNASVPARLAERSDHEIRPAQLVCLKADVPDTLILREIPT